MPESCSQEYFEHLIVDPDRNNGLRLVENTAIAEYSEYSQEEMWQWHMPLIPALGGQRKVVGPLGA